MAGGTRIIVSPVETSLKAGTFDPTVKLKFCSLMLSLGVGDGLVNSIV